MTSAIESLVNSFFISDGSECFVGVFCVYILNYVGVFCVYVLNYVCTSASRFLRFVRIFMFVYLFIFVSMYGCFVRILFCLSSCVCLWVLLVLAYACLYILFIFVYMFVRFTDISDWFT